MSFLNSASLEPVPPVESKDENARYFHIFEDDEFAATQLAAWISQASQIPGWTGF